MKVCLDDLQGQPQNRVILSFKETIEGLEAVKPVVGELVLTLNTSGARLSGKVQTLLKLECDRCLRPFFSSLVVEIDEKFVHREWQEPTRERELGKSDFVELLPADGMLDITDVVYQAITLATPPISFCGDECPGVPGQNEAGGSLGEDKLPEKAMDPRWKNLKTLFSSNENEQKS